MTEKRFGDILHERRRRLGISIDQAVNATKLRPQVLEAFERSDFSSLPPRGYAQGMLTSYARFLRLNPRDVLSAYFDQLYVYERERDFSLKSERSSLRTPSRDEVQRRRTGRSELSHNQDLDSYYQQRLEPDRSYGKVYSRYQRQSSANGPVGLPHSFGARRAGQSTRNQASYDKFDGFDESYPAYPPQRLQAAYEDYEEYDSRARASRTQAQRSKSSQKLGSYRPHQSRNLLSDFADGLSARFGIDTRLVYGAALLLVVIILAVLFFAIKSCTAPKTTGSTQEQRVVTPVAQSKPAPGSQTNTTGTANSNQGAAANSQDSSTQDQVTQDPQEQNHILSITIASGKKSYLDIQADGKMLAYKTFTGPITESYSFKESIKVNATEPSSVSLSLDGDKVKFKSTGSSGVFNYVVPQAKANETQAEGSDTNAEQSNGSNKTSSTKNNAN